VIVISGGLLNKPPSFILASSFRVALERFPLDLNKTCL
jgi:hypothetical protein